MCPRPEQQIADAFVRAALAVSEAEEMALNGKNLQEVRRILVAMRYEAALELFDEVTGDDPDWWTRIKDIPMDAAARVRER